MENIDYKIFLDEIKNVLHNEKKISVTTLITFSNDRVTINEPLIEVIGLSPNNTDGTKMMLVIRANATLTFSALKRIKREYHSVFELLPDESHREQCKQIVLKDICEDLLLKFPWIDDEKLKKK